MKNKTWKVELRDSCKVCGGALPNTRFRTYCSAKCRLKHSNLKAIESGYHKKYQRDRLDKLASIPDPEHKCQCLICGNWYIQLGSHVRQSHHMLAREYREYFELEVKRGITPAWYRKEKGDQALDNETYKNLAKGVKHRFQKGDKSAGKYKRSPVTIERLKNLHKMARK